MKADSSILPVIAVLGAVFLWGGSFAAAKTALSSLDPWTVVWFRMVLGVLVGLPFLKKFFRFHYCRKDLKYLVLMVLFQPCLYFLFEAYALTYTTSAQAGVIAASVPLLVSVGAWLLFSEKITFKTVFGLLISVAGVCVLTMSGSSSANAANPLLGNLLEICAMICTAGYMLLMKKMSSSYSPFALTFIQTLGGAVFFIPGAFRMNWSMHLSSSLIFSLLFLGCFVTLGAFGLYNYAISRIKASEASAYINLVPVVAVCLGWIFLGEALNPVQSVASVAVLFGVWISQGSGMRKKKLAVEVG
ncbi:DMT family transporter [Maridesulfovibrio bastinii]|uniref:DMT family transporter n=1 Tax=Maridesulfovibrio bastinii TaxID=47157 RepID=UPI0003F9EDAB|nr:EamA family transporter [Maridesulfovibrio bastinii]